MEKTIAKKTLDFGKINYYGTGKRYKATVEMELRKCGGEKTFIIEKGEKVYTGKETPVYYEFSACGYVWNSLQTDIICGGQCLDEMKKFLGKNKDFNQVYTWWKLYHLNGMNAGTPEQEKAINEWKKAGNKYDYTAVCDYLKSIDLYEINFTGKSTGKYYNNELYRYGTAWIIEEIPENDFNAILKFIENN